MLNSQTIAIIKSTVPVLETHGKAITTRFYETMFKNNPELLNIFNHANQKQGRQQTALANAVYAAAANIDHLEAILPAVKQIAHKHRSLGIKPEHYPIVGRNLLAAIKDVLGDAATDEIIAAWGEAYNYIADAFISVEQAMYQEAGWVDFKSFIVTKKVQESSVITSFYLRPADGAPLPDYQPGQYISVRVDIPDEEHTHIRQYSLSDAPGLDYYRISVKREDFGVVSRYLHSQIQEGDSLNISAPSGDFTLDMKNQCPVVLLSGGVGLTPMVSMLNTLVKFQPQRNVTFIHAAINSEVHAMRDHVVSLSAEHSNLQSYFCYEKPTEKDRTEKLFHKEGYIDLSWLQSILQDNQADFYFCGPVPFMRALYQALLNWGVPNERIHFEFFGPSMELEAVPTAAAQR